MSSHEKNSRYRQRGKKQVLPPDDSGIDPEQPVGNDPVDSTTRGLITAENLQASVIPRIAGIDSDQVTQTVGHNREFFLELLRMFLSRFGNSAHHIRTDLALGNRVAAVERLHALRGTAGNLGAMALTEAAHALEQAIADGLSNQAPLLEQFTTLLASLSAAGAPWLEERVAAPPARRAPELDQSRLAKLHQALGCNDLSALDLFDQLEPGLTVVYGAETIRTMAEALQSLRFEEVLALMGETE